MATNPKQGKPLILQYLPKIGNYLLGISVICYISGFIITNLYLGSLGIVNLEILRSRYILSGLLFLVFLGAIVYLLYGLIKTLQKYQAKSASSILIRVIWHSIGNICMLLFVIPVFAILAGSVKNPPIGLPQLSPITPWSEWFKTVPRDLLPQTALLYGIVIGSIIFVMGIVIAINPKDNVRRSRKQWLREIFADVWNNKLKTIGVFCVIFIGLYLWYFMINALEFLATNKISDLQANTMSQAIISPSDIGWLRFFLMIVIIYVLFALWITSVFLSASKNKNATADDNPIAWIHGLIYITTVVIILVIPTYTLGVYPNIPQQIGGGQIIRVDTQISNTDVNDVFSEPNTTIYLIDRTTRTSIFYLINNATNEYKIQEIPNDLILRITYNP